MTKGPLHYVSPSKPLLSALAILGCLAANPGIAGQAPQASEDAARLELEAQRASWMKRLEDSRASRLQGLEDARASRVQRLEDSRASRIQRLESSRASRMKNLTTAVGRSQDAWLETEQRQKTEQIELKKRQQAEQQVLQQRQPSEPAALANQQQSEQVKLLTEQRAEPLPVPAKQWNEWNALKSKQWNERNAVSSRHWNAWNVLSSKQWNEWNALSNKQWNEWSALNAAGPAVSGGAPVSPASAPVAPPTQTATPGPGLTAISPPSVTGSKTAQTFSLKGSNLQLGVRVTVYATNFQKMLSQVRWIGPSEAQMTIMTDTVADNWSVEVTNPDGKRSGRTGFRVNAPAGPVATPPVAVAPRATQTVPNATPTQQAPSPAPTGTVTVASPSLNAVMPSTVTGSKAPQTFTLTGANLQNGLRVTVHATNFQKTLDPVQVRWISPSQHQMTIVTDTVADSWRVEVTNPDGRSSARVGFRVDPPAPDLSVATGSPASATPHAQGGAGAAPATVAPSIASSTSPSNANPKACPGSPAPDTSSLTPPLRGQMKVSAEGSFADPAYNNGVKRDLWREHLGTDYPAGGGTAVFAARPGRVVENVPAKDPYRAVVILEHLDRSRTVYGHIASSLPIGCEIAQGAELGRVRDDSDEYRFKSHLHYGENVLGKASKTPTHDGWGWGRAPFGVSVDEMQKRGWIDTERIHRWAR